MCIGGGGSALGGRNASDHGVSNRQAMRKNMFFKQAVGPQLAKRAPRLSKLFGRVGAAASSARVCSVNGFWAGPQSAERSRQVGPKKNEKKAGKTRKTSISRGTSSRGRPHEKGSPPPGVDEANSSCMLTFAFFAAARGSGKICENRKTKTFKPSSV